MRRTFLFFAALCLSAAAAYSQQDCNGYLRLATELQSQKNYCDAKRYYQMYSDCNADVDVSTEIAMCERLCNIRGVGSGKNKPIDTRDCNSYLRLATELQSQKNYCDAKIYYQKYSNCNADADVSTEIAMCNRFIEIQKLNCGKSEPDSKTEWEDNRTLTQIPARKKPQEFSIFGGGGLSFMAYRSPLNKISSTGYNGELGVGFTGFVSPQCGFHIGAGLGMLNVEAKAGDIKNISSGLTDRNGYRFDLHSTLHDYSEIQKTMSLYIPLMVQFQTKQKPDNNSASFYLMTGAKLHLLLSRTYDSRISAFSNAAYYPDADNWATTQTFAGLGKFAGNNNNGKLGTGVLAMFAIETGMKFRIGENLYLYTGAYFDYGLNDPTKNERKSVSDYTSVNSLPELSLLDVYKNSFLMDVGIKLRLAFNNK